MTNSAELVVSSCTFAMKIKHNPKKIYSLLTYIPFRKYISCSAITIIHKAMTWNIFNNTFSLVIWVFGIGKAILDYLNDKNEPEHLCYTFIQSSHVYLSENISLVLPLQLFTKQWHEMHWTNHFL